MTTHPAWPVFWAFARLGLTSFGGPVAHLGFFRAEFVVRRRWLSERDHADLVALCQFLPGPASSQVGMALGLRRAGWPGALAAWLGFTLPSALVLAALGAGMAVADLGHPLVQGALHGLKVAAVAVVAQAVWGMARQLCPTLAHRVLMALAAAASLGLPSVWTQPGLIALGAGWGMWRWQRSMAALPTLPTLPAHAAQTVQPDPPDSTWHRGQHMGPPTAQRIGTGTDAGFGMGTGIGSGMSKRMGVVCLLLFAALLLGLPWVAQRYPAQPAWAVLDAFYRAGALVFGGGHVVLPLLHAEVVNPGWVAHDTFLAGYAAAQAVPGPLFTLAAFLGAAMPGMLPAGTGALVAVVGVFAPSFLLVAGALPFWDSLRQRPRAQAALAGANAVVVGLLLAALVHPVASSALWPWGATAQTAAAAGTMGTAGALEALGAMQAIGSVGAVGWGPLVWWALVVTATTALVRGRVPAWAVVGVCGVLGLCLAALHVA